LWSSNDIFDAEERKRKEETEMLRKMYEESQDQIWANWEYFYGWKRPEDKKENKG
jgi:hypothetical protein